MGQHRFPLAKRPRTTESNNGTAVALRPSAVCARSCACAGPNQAGQLMSAGASVLKAVEGWARSSSAIAQMAHKTRSALRAKCRQNCRISGRARVRMPAGLRRPSYSLREFACHPEGGKSLVAPGCVFRTLRAPFSRGPSCALTSPGTDFPAQALPRGFTKMVKLSHHARGSTLNPLIMGSWTRFATASRQSASVRT